MRIEPLDSALGARISHIDLSKSVTPSQARRLRDALDTFEVIFFADQRLNRADHKRVTEIFGPLTRVPYIRAMDDDPDIIAVLKEADEKKISNFGGAWHSDFSFLAEPPGGSVLYALEIPPAGGDTLWASQTAAYRLLPSALRDFVDHADAIHVGAPYGVAHAPNSKRRLSPSIAMTRGDANADRETHHPAVRVHPRTGKRALFINPIYTVRFAHLDVEQSKPILQAIYRYATAPDVQYRFQWSIGTVAVWDNRTTLHLARNDYDGHRRLLHRTTFAGEVPQSSSECAPEPTQRSTANPNQRDRLMQP
ncbi:MAG: TauD/TfdA family dioxygenase [Pseudomonadota bacterium]